MLASPSEGSTLTRRSFGLQHTWQSSVYSWYSPADASTSVALTWKQKTQTNEDSISMHPRYHSAGSGATCLRV